MIGFDLLFLAHKRWPMRLSMNVIPNGVPIQVFDDPAGDVMSHLATWVKEKAPPSVSIHAHWDNDHEICPVKKLEKKCRKYQNFAASRPGLKVYVSHSCEYKESDPHKIRERINIIRSLAPACFPVNTPMGGSATLQGVLTQRHGAKAYGELVSLDGDNAYDINVVDWLEKNKESLVRYLWGYRFNFREIGDPGQVPPPYSERMAIPNRQYFEMMVRLSQPIGEAPAPRFGNVEALKSPNLWKPCAEDDQEPNEVTPDDPRENRPVAILEYSGSEIELVTWDNRIVGKMPRWNDMNASNLQRFYSGVRNGIRLYGYQIGRRAKSMSGSEWIWLRAGRKNYGPINPAFRFGYFR